MNDDVKFPHSLWAAVTADREPASPLKEAAEADVAIVGGGFTGLTAALTLARKGSKPVLLEARAVGWGASGRNNGQVIPTLSGVEPDTIVRRYGDVGERFVRLVGGSASHLFDLVRDENIEAEAEQTGWIQPAHSPGRLKLSEQRVHAWNRFGFPAELIDADAMKEKLGTGLWFGGMVNPTGGHINPLALARGLAAAAERHGARIFENSPATGWSHDGSRWLISTPKSTLRAPAMLIATHAYTAELVPELAPRLARTVVPVLGLQAATEPLDMQMRAAILPGRQAVSDTRGDLRFFRYDARNRLVSGGAFVTERNAEERIKATVHDRLIHAYPQLRSCRMTHSWSGYIGVTPDRFPHVFQLGPDAWAWTGCNGRGVALSVSIGDRLAGVVAGESVTELGLPVSELSPMPFYELSRSIAPAYLAWMRVMDRIEPR